MTDTPNDFTSFFETRRFSELHPSEVLMQVERRTIQDLAQKEMDDPVTGRMVASIVDVDSGDEIFGHSSDDSVMIASLTKILTAGACLEHLGADARFCTRFVAERAIDSDGVLEGDLYIIGDGDPTIGDEDHVQEFYGGDGTSVDDLVGSLRRSGLKRVSGSLIGDGSLFHTDSKFGGWYPALSFNRSKSTDAVANAAQSIAEAMEAAGIVVESGSARGRFTHETPVEIASVESPTVKSLAIRAGHESDNFVSEILTKQLGRLVSGSSPSRTSDGCTVIAQHVAGHGLEMDLMNGSGMRIPGSGDPVGNHAAAGQFTTYLRSVATQRYGQDLLDTLPGAGREGTLEMRMRNTSAAHTVRAKTGTLTRDKKPLVDALA